MKVVTKANNLKLEMPKLVASGKMSRVDAAKCTRRQSGHATCSIRPNTN